MNLIQKVLRSLNKVMGSGLDRNIQDFVYIDKGALYEHYKAMTGLDRVPAKFSESVSGGAGAKLLVADLSTSAQAGVDYEISEPHLLESLLPFLRKHPAVTDEKGLIDSLRGFGWFRGRMSWMKVGDRLTYTLDSGRLATSLGCRREGFRPFYTFRSENPDHYKYEALDVELLAYNPGILAEYGSNLHEGSGRGLLLVPTAILLAEGSPRKDIAQWLRDHNSGALSRPLESRPVRKSPG